MYLKLKSILLFKIISLLASILFISPAKAVTFVNVSPKYGLFFEIYKCNDGSDKKFLEKIKLPAGTIRDWAWEAGVSPDNMPKTLCIVVSSETTEQTKIDSIKNSQLCTITAYYPPTQADEQGNITTNVYDGCSEKNTKDTKKPL